MCPTLERPGALAGKTREGASMEITDADGGLLAVGGFFWVIYMAVIILYIVAMWKIYTKAGKPGWAAIIPFYNIYVLLEIVGRPGWWLILYFIPFVNFIVHIVVQLDLAKSFGRGLGFAAGLILFPYIWGMILGFGGDTYKGQGAVIA